MDNRVSRVSRLIQFHSCVSSLLTMICPGMSPGMSPGSSAPYLVTSARPAHTRQATPLATPLAPPPVAGLVAVLRLHTPLASNTGAAARPGHPRPGPVTVWSPGEIQAPAPVLSRHTKLQIYQILL